MRPGKPPAGMPGGLNPGGTTSEAPSGRGCGCWGLDGAVPKLDSFPARMPVTSVGVIGGALPAALCCQAA